MKLYLVRHTKTDCVPGVCYGRSDVGLDGSFEVEKETLLKKLSDIEFEEIYSSPAIRCSLLAEAFSGKVKSIKYDDRLKELDFGIWEGKTWNEIEKSEEAKLWYKDYVNIPCPGGESYSDLLERVESFILDLKKIISDKNILIICHGGTIRAFYSIINKIPPQKAFDLKIDYGQILEIELKSR